MPIDPWVGRPRTQGLEGLTMPLITEYGAVEYGAVEYGAVEYGAVAAEDTASPPEPPA